MLVDEVFPYQIALAEFDLAQGNVTDSIQLLEKLATAQILVSMLWRRRSNWPKFTSAGRISMRLNHW